MSDGRIVVLTGGSRGLGYSGAHRLACRGATVVLTARTAQRAATAAESIRTAVPGARVYGVELDLSSWASVRRAAAEIGDRTPRLDVLLANAAAPPPRRRTESVEGHELVMATNHLGHFLLTALLMPTLHATAAAHGEARVVVVSSRLHRPGWPGPQPRFDVTDLDLRRVPYRPMRAYKHSKLANLLFTFELDRRERARGVRAVALCPGFVPDSVADNHPNGRNLAFRHLYPALPFARRRDSAADAYTHAATAALDEIAGRFLGDRRPITSSRQSRDRDLAARLWRISEELTVAP